MHISLARLLGVNAYGSFGMVMALNGILATVVFNGMFETTSKLVAQYPHRQHDIISSGLKIQVVFSLILVLGYYLCAEIAAEFFGNSQLKILIRISASSLILWAISAAYIGTLGGLRKFGKQALVLGLNSILKFVAILLFVYTGYKLTGAIFGYVISLLPGVILARYFCSIKKSGQGFSYKKIIGFALPLIANSLLYILVINMDLLLVQKILKDTVKTGLYTSASTIAKSLWIFFAAFSATLLPSISKSVSEKNATLTKSYIRQSLRYLTISIIPIAFLLSGLSRGVVRMLFTSEFMPAAQPLSILILGLGLFTLSTLLNTIITGGGRPKIPLLFSSLTIAFAFILNSIMIPRYGLTGAALASTISFFFGLVIAAIYVYRQFRALIDPVSLFKIIASSVILWLIASKFTLFGLALILQAGVLLIIYIFLLFVFREIKEQDLQVLGNIIGGNLQKRFPSI